MTNNEILIHTDGACSGNPGPGGWAAVLLWNNHRREIAGYVPDTTNNRMELQAVIEALRAIKSTSYAVRIVTDSAYIHNAFTKGWIDKWIRINWVRKGEGPVKNRDLWEELLELAKPFQITWEWTRGHSDNPLNNRCDELARNAIRQKNRPA